MKLIELTCQQTTDQQLVLGWLWMLIFLTL